MALVVTLGLFCAGLFIIIKGGDILVRHAIAINKKTGINQVIIGATFVSVATTLPEVFVSIFAVSAGNHEIAIGNALGAMAANIGLVLGVTFLFAGATVSRRDALWKAIFMLVTIVVVFLFAMNRAISWHEGIILLAGFVVFLWLNVRESQRPPPCARPLDERLAGVTPGPGSPVGDGFVRHGGGADTKPDTDCDVSWWKIAFGFVAGQTMLCIGAFVLVRYGEQLAHIVGISETVIGFTIIALGTSLPELLTAVASIKRRSGGLALGNVIGANVINATLLFGVCGLIGDIRGADLPLDATTAFVAIPALFLMTLIATLPVIIKGRAAKWQGVALIMSYIGFVVFLVMV